MKPTHLFRFTALLLLSFNFFHASALVPGGSVMGRVIDPATKEPVAFATVVFDCQGSQQVFSANEKGYYYASNIPACTYTVSALYMSSRISLPPVKISNGESIEMNIELAMGTVTMPDADVFGKKGVHYKPLIDPINPTAVTLTREDFKDQPLINVNDLVPMQAAVVKIGNDVYVHGSRAGGLVYYIDDCRVMGDPTIPLTGLDVYRVYTGFLPPRYGDTTGGAIVMETRSSFTE